MADKQSNRPMAKPKRVAIARRVRSIQAEAAFSGSASPRREEVAGQVHLPAFDRIIHERLRLGIVTALAANDSLAFSDLKRLLKTTDGNLSVHARKLEDADYIACDKSFRNRMPHTAYRLTVAGRRALEYYLSEMEDFVRAARG